MRRKTILLLLSVISFHAYSIERNDSVFNDGAVVTNSFWDNWYGEIGGNMSLFNPYGSNIRNIIPNGMSFGIEAAVRKQFSPIFGFRGRLNWQNGILKNERATWLENGDSKHGGYFVLSGDVLLNIHNLLGEYNQFRVWNLSVYPRMGAFVAMKNKDGSPLLGFGVNNTFRLTDKINLNVDASYQVISSAMGEKT